MVRLYIQKLNELIFEKVFSYYLNYWTKKYFDPNSYKYFNRIDDINEWGKCFDNYYISIREKYDKDWLKDRRYYPQVVLEHYAGYYSLKVNAFLRGNDRWELVFIEDIVKEHINILNREININKLNENIVTIRRLPNSVFEMSEREYQHENSFIDNGFLSTSLNLFYRKDNEGRHLPLNNETLLVIMVNKGVNALYLEQISNREEYELLLPSKSRFEILKRISVLNNKIVLVKLV